MVVISTGKNMKLEHSVMGLLVITIAIINMGYCCNSIAAMVINGCGIVTGLLIASIPLLKE